MKLKSVLKAVAVTLACTFDIGIIPISNKFISQLSITASAETYYVTFPEENVDYYIAAESNTNYVIDLYGGGTETYTGFHVYERNGSGAQIFTLKRVDGDWYIIIHKESGKCLNVVNGDSYDDARFWLYPYDEGDFATQFRFAAAGDSYIIQNRLDTQRIIDLHDNIAYSGAKLHLWSLHDGQSGRWKLIPVNSSQDTYNQGSYSNFAKGAYIVNTSDGVNVRDGAGTGYRRVGASVYGTTFKVLETNGNWGYTNSIKTTSGLKSGWVCLTYCNILPDDYSNNNSDNGSIYLDVPMYLQGDKRWRSAELGDTKYTIWGYGCTVTGLAMMYSYNNSCTIYPNEIIQYLKFNQYGAVYWSGIYNLGFTRKSYTGSISQSCMRTIYNQLAEGRPVMIGATNSKGDEHWVVITGYSGNTNSFDSAYFSINDPAGNHATLKQFLGYVDNVKYIVY